MKLTDTQWRALAELEATCAESRRYWPENEGWVRTYDLSGSRYERSSSVLRALIAKGCAEGTKHNTYNRQGQWSWRITPVGIEAILCRESSRVSGS